MIRFVRFWAAVATVAAAAAYSQEPAREKTPAEIKREAVLEEFGRDYFAFARAFHLALWNDLQAKRLTAAQYADASHTFFSALEHPANFADLYDGQQAAGQRTLQATAAALRREQRIAAEAAAEAALARESLLKAD